MKERTVDVVVVGAGLSGLQAAVTIHEAGLSCVVLEAMDRVGGKTLSVDASPHGGKVDLGAAWINDTNQSYMYALAEKFSFALKKQHATGLNLHQDENGDVVTFPHGEQIPMPDEDKAKLDEFFQVFESYIEQSDLENPHLGPHAKDLDSITLQEFAEKHFETAHAQLIVAQLGPAWLGAEAEEMSALYLVDYCKSGTGVKNMSSDLKNGGQYLRNRQGNQSFSTRLAGCLRPHSVHLSSPVSKITQAADKNCVVETTNGMTVCCKKVIISIPTTLYPSIEFSPPLPPAKHRLSESTVLGYYAKMIFVFEKPWWRDAGLSGLFNSAVGPTSFSRDTCFEEDNQYSITCFLVGDKGRRWSKFSKSARRQQVQDQFYAIFGAAVKDIPEPINVIEKEWVKDPWARGAPCPVMPPGVMTSDAGQAIRDVFGDMHFVGTETALVWKGYMEGAVRSGVRGATEVIKALWKTEPPPYIDVTQSC